MERNLYQNFPVAQHMQYQSLHFSYKDRISIVLCLSSRTWTFYASFFNTLANEFLVIYG